MTPYDAITALVEYALERRLIAPEDATWATNGILEALQLDSLEPDACECSEAEGQPNNPDLEEILGVLLSDAESRGLIGGTITERDLLDTKVMGALTPRPSAVIDEFWSLYSDSPEIATDWFYNFNQDVDYIRRYRIAKDVKWTEPTEYGELDITINLSKPEKDPKDIAAAKLAPQGGYPKCLLCRENEGYAGRVNHPARQNLRMIPIELDGKQWFFQYSPYVYYNEHCIVLSSQHRPMKIDARTFRRLLDFVKMFPSYFIGSNADLPIVGGSILSHDHFQGGRHEFAMAKAPIDEAFAFPRFEDVEAGIVKWPMSVIRLRSADDSALVDLAAKILGAWRGYTDEDAFVFAETDGEPHNTITPICRFRDGAFELDLVLRNNITTPEHPLGVYHPHEELHHIKKENIGLIEVMGLAVLPGRLSTELLDLANALVAGEDLRARESTSKHAEWAEGLKDKHDFTEANALGILKSEVGQVFATVLEHAGVFKRTPEGREAFMRFIESVA